MYETRTIEDVTNDFPKAKEKNLEVKYNTDSFEFQVSDGDFCYSFYDDDYGNGTRKVEEFIREY